MHVDPTSEQAEAFAASADAGEPVLMLNLLQFRPEATDPESGDRMAGAELYARYVAATAKHLARVGGEVVWAGECDNALIGPDATEWDVAAVVRYPSRRAFLEMVGDPDYLETSKLRTAALADSRLIPCDEATLGAR
jgi:uncharacterized protein (DUF1330 family)